MSFKRKAYFLIGFFCFITSSINGQDQKKSDSLISLYNSGIYQDKELDLLTSILKYESNPSVSIKYSELLIEKAYPDSLFKYLLNGYLQKGNALQIKGNNLEALEAYLVSIKLASRIDNQKDIGQINISIADTYSIIGNSLTAQKYYEKGISLLRKLNDSVSLGTALLNAGDEYFNTENYEKAVTYFEESGQIFKDIDYLIGTAYNLGNVGMVYAEQGKDDLAETNINEAIKILEDLEDFYPISVYLTYMADIYINKNDIPTALNYAERSLSLANQYGLKDQISDANLKLSELYDNLGDSDKGYQHYRDYIVYRDSVINIETVQKMESQRTDYEVSQKQAELDLSNQKKKTQKIILFATIGILLLIGILALGLLKRNKFVRATNKIITIERERSDNLLLNILPESTANELKEYGKVKPLKFDSVSVLFTDFEGFTRYSSHLSPEELVETVDYYFSKFDEIIEKYKLEKIKTIGDAYMCAGGLPFPSEDHAHKMVLAAFEIANFVGKVQKEDKKSNFNFNVRIGINTGPVVAGVVGSKKFAYDIWGDTVNIASRMESNSGLGKINVSENTYQLIKDNFECEYRGEIDAKNRGMMKMYFVNSIKKTNKKTEKYVTTRS